ncbi:MAG TPA: hypothetical protein PKK43_01755 [Spirochaetota bacterium]|nr:hypothetical protein [Spirochaetota bacterium]
MLKPSAFEFLNAIDEKMLMQLRILVLSFVIGIVGFAGVIYYIFLMNSIPPELSPETDFRLLTAITAGISAVFIPLSIFVPGRFLSAKLRVSGESLTTNDAFARIRTSCIIRAALLELPSLFGLCVITIAVMRGYMQTHPFYWINIVPALIMILSLLFQIPTREKIRFWYELIP